MAVTDAPMDTLAQILSDALTAAASAFPSDPEAFIPPADGISLLDVKNELLLSYLQNLAFLVVLKLRHTSLENTTIDIHNTLVHKLTELRIYLERGVRPLEGRLKYQIEQVLRAASDATPAEQSVNTQKYGLNGTRNVSGDAEHSMSDSESSDEPRSALVDTTNDLAHRPNVRNIVDKLDRRRQVPPSTRKDGTYKPPRITPTAMPENADRKREPRKRKSQLLDEYIDEELSTAPRAQPSIGSNNTILEHGRGAMSKRDREKRKERTEYEERNFTRLPGESKAEKRKAKLRGEYDKRDMFGGEDWTGLGGLGDRVSKSVSGRGQVSSIGVLQRREKRRATEDSPRGDGTAIGDTFEKRRRVLQGRAERKSGTKRR